MTAVAQTGWTQEQTNALPTSQLNEYMEAGAEVAGVRVPYYDENGNLQAELFGGAVRIMDGGKAHVTNIRIRVYDKDTLAMTVFAPQCVTHVIEKGTHKILQVESDGDVLIESEQMTISGRGFRFSSDSNRFEILSEAKVLVKASAREIEGMTL